MNSSCSLKVLTVFAGFLLLYLNHDVWMWNILQKDVIFIIFMPLFISMSVMSLHLLLGARQSVSSPSSLLLHIFLSISFAFFPLHPAVLKKHRFFFSVSSVISLLHKHHMCLCALTWTPALSSHWDVTEPSSYMEQLKQVTHDRTQSASTISPYSLFYSYSHVLPMKPATIHLWGA